MIYSVEEYNETLPLREFISKFRDFAKFNALCRECPQYNRNWACPPFSFDIEKILLKYEYILFHVSKVSPEEKNLPLSFSRELLKPERIKLESKFIGLEKETGGRFLGFAGSCPNCAENSCSRLTGNPCRNPALCHPSLEAYGFDLCKATEEIFNIPILWSKDGLMPSYLTLVCGLLFSDKTLI